MFDRPDRRAVLGGMAAFAATPAAAQPVFLTDPFKLGVASGSPTASAVVLWTRLAPDPLAVGGGMDPVPVAVRWVVSDRPDLSRILAGGTAMARPDRAHAVHVDARGLKPGRRYWYRFFAGAAASPIGATRTLPDANARVGQIRFATVSCQNFAQGWFSAYDAIVEDEPDFVLHLGDYIYETGFGATVRRHETDGPISTLDDYRRRHALYKTDPSLARAHAAVPFIATLDNHDAVVDGSRETSSLRAATYRAWAEHMPVRDFLQAEASRAHVAQNAVLGDLMHIEIPDTRQFRDRLDICGESQDQALGFGGFRIPCAAQAAPDRSMLGAAQERSLAQAFARETRVWSVLATTVPFAPYVLEARSARRFYTATWSAYPAAAERMAATLRAAPIQNLVMLSGDVHSSWIWDIRERADDPASAFGTEIVTTSISSDCPPPLAAPMVASLPHNPHVHFHDVEKRGYVLHTVTREAWKTEIKLIDDVRVPVSTVRTARRAVIRAGRAGVADLD